MVFDTMSLLLFVAISMSFSVTQALDRYRHDSTKHGLSLFDPLNATGIQLVDCKTLFNPNQNRTCEITFECVREEKAFLGENRILCTPRNCTINCRSPEKCNISYRNNRCNSSKNIKLSLALNLIAFLIFYKCTKY